MAITPEQAAAELARRRAATSTPVTPEQARAELERRRGAKPAEPNILPVPAAKPGEESLLTKIGGRIKRAYNDIKSNPLDVNRAILRSSGAVAGSINDTVGAVLEPVFNKVTDTVAAVPTVQKFAASKPVSGTLDAINSGIGTTVGAAQNAFNRLPEKIQQDTKDTANIVSVLPIGKGAQMTARAAKSSIAANSGEASANIMTRVARINPTAERKFTQMAGTTPGKYLVERGIYGNETDIITQLAQRATQSRTLADDELAKLGGTWKHQPVTTALEELAAREARVSTPGAPSRDLARVNALLEKDKAGGLTMSEINETKRLYERNVRLDYLRQNLPESVSKANNIDSAIRKWQFEQAKKLGLNNLDQINKETQLAKELGTELWKKVTGGQANNAFSLTDAVLLSGGDPQAVSMLIARKVGGSKGLQSKVAKILAPEPTVGAPKAVNRAPITDRTRLLPAPSGQTSPIILPSSVDRLMTPTERVRPGAIRMPQRPVEERLALPAAGDSSYRDFRLPSTADMLMKPAERTRPGAIRLPSRSDTTPTPPQSPQGQQSLTLPTTVPPAKANASALPTASSAQALAGKTSFRNPITGAAQDVMGIPPDWASYSSADKRLYLDSLKKWYADNDLPPPF